MSSRGQAEGIAELTSLCAIEVNVKVGVAGMILWLIETQRGRDAAAVAAFAQASKTLPDNLLAASYLGQSLVGVFVTV